MSLSYPGGSSLINEPLLTVQQTLPRWSQRESVERKVREIPSVSMGWFWDVTGPCTIAAERFLDVKGCPRLTASKKRLSTEAVEFYPQPKWAWTDSSPEPREGNAALPSPWLWSYEILRRETSWATLYPESDLQKPRVNNHMNIVLCHWICGNFYSNTNEYNHQPK